MGWRLLKGRAPHRGERFAAELGYGSSPRVENVSEQRSIMPDRFDLVCVELFMDDMELR